MTYFKPNFSVKFIIFATLSFPTISTSKKIKTPKLLFSSKIYHLHNVVLAIDQCSHMYMNHCC